MPTLLNNSAYSKLIQEDIDWLLDNTDDSLERRHIISIIKAHEKDIITNGK